MKKIIKVIKALLFIIVCNACLSVIASVLQYESEMEPDITMKEFYALDRDTVQMIVVGTSHNAMGYSPMECYKQTQITSFSLSTAKQPIELSYYLVEESLKTQSPEVVVCDVANLFYKESDITQAAFRYVLDSMPFSLTKVKLASCYANYNPNEYKIFSIGEAISPIFYYHNRWKELKEEDFDYVTKAMPHLKGQVLRINMKDMKYDLAKQDKKLAEAIKSDPSAAPEVNDKNLSYLLKLKELCDKNDINLLLTITPTKKWNSTKRKIIEEISEKYDLDFLDMNLADGELVDYSHNMADGNHTNASGAQKTTMYLCDYVMSNYGVEGKECQDYEDSLKYYDAYWDHMIKYNMATDFNEYLTLLTDNKEDLAIFICANGDSVDGLNEDDIAQLHTLGCVGSFDMYSNNSYIAVIDGGKMVYEAADMDDLSYSYQVGTDIEAKLFSNGYSKTGKASIDIGGKEYAINSPGFNIVIFDKESNLVVDSVAFNTHDTSKKWYRGEDRKLELFICKNYREWVSQNY